MARRQRHGGLLYPNFVETVPRDSPMYWARFIAGILYIAGILLMAWNLITTARARCSGRW